MDLQEVATGTERVQLYGGALGARTLVQVQAFPQAPRVHRYTSGEEKQT